MFPIEIVRQLTGKRLNSFTCSVFSARSFFRDRNNASLAVKPVFHNALQYPNKTAIYDNTGNYSFSNIFVEAQELSGKISRQLSGRIGERVLFLCPNDASYVITIWAIWMSGQIAVPLSPLHPEPLLEYYINDTNSRLLVTSPHFKDKLGELSTKARVKLYVLSNGLLEASKSKTCIEESTLHNTLPFDFYQDRDAMILYTSGTTGNPKGVVLTHKNISVQVKTLTDAWKWSHKDVMLHTLPLHHVHGTVNALFCPLFIGATTVMLPKFNARDVWAFLLNKNEGVKERVSVFMAVPTIYSKLIEEYELMNLSNAATIRQFLMSNVRLMVSGSAPLPTPLYDAWLRMSGHKLLERYGMTEVGMCLSNLYDSEREPGYVGLPLPSVTVALADQDNDDGDILLTCHHRSDGEITLSEAAGDVTGELLVKGASVFKEYYNKPKETAKEFTDDKWFKTGDISQYVKDKNSFRMLGRKSADIIKSGGYKISALQIETLLLAHHSIKECAVLGVTDEVYGERVAVVAVVNKGQQLSLNELRAWALERMPKYWVPTVLKIVEDIPKNAMGKINKKELNKALFINK